MAYLPRSFCRSDGCRRRSAAIIRAHPKFNHTLIFLPENSSSSFASSFAINDNISNKWRNSNFGLKTNHVPKIDMRKFDGKDPITWILQMEQFFDIHNVPHTQKVRIAFLYLEPNQFLWYLWLCSHKSLVTWTIFMK
jgi:hypothetical protein